MDIFSKFKNHFVFTKNEQKVFLFLSVVLLAGIGIKYYKNYAGPAENQHFDYSQTDSIFDSRNKMLMTDSLLVNSSKPSMKIKININTASKKDLVELPGIGETMAARIILFREEKGSFKSLAELKKVKGVGDKKFDRLKDFIKIE
jgi:comEA protein